MDVDDTLSSITHIKIIEHCFFISILHFTMIVDCFLYLLLYHTSYTYIQLQIQINISQFIVQFS